MIREGIEIQEEFYGSLSFRRIESLMSSKDEKILKRKDIIFNYLGKYEMNFF